MRTIDDEINEVAEAFRVFVTHHALSDGSVVFNVEIDDAVCIACSSQDAAYECRTEIATAIHKATR